MSLRSLGNQFGEELKANWAKSALLGTLLLVGLYLWIPPLFRAVFSEPPAATVPVAPSEASYPPPVEKEMSFQKDATATASSPGEVSWNNVDDLLASDPLVRSVEVAAIQGDPFRVADAPLRPPLLFVETEDNEPEPEPEPPQQDPADLLTLKSIIVGARRRAAFINDTLRFEGSEFNEEGLAFVLEAVHSEKVVLRHDKSRIELYLPQPSASGRIDFTR